MDTSLIISAASSIIACSALWVSYKAYVQSNAFRFDEKVLSIRIQAVELIFKINETKRKSIELAKKHPTKHDETIHEQQDVFISQIEEVLKKLSKPDLKVNNSDLNDIKIQLLSLEKMINNQHEQIIKFIENA